MHILEGEVDEQPRYGRPLRSRIRRETESICAGWKDEAALETVSSARTRARFRGRTTGGSVTSLLRLPLQAQAGFSGS
jgi:hypothetical protein